jgi:serine/threonine protein kinase
MIWLWFDEIGLVEEHLSGLQAGTVIGGRYEVVQCLGAGSMGLVYACRHKELGGHMVAVKVLFPDVAQDQIAAQRFRNEIFASYGVSHPNVVRAYEYVNEGELIAYSMEFVGGGDLADRLAGDELMPIEESVRLLIQMCQGVQAIHNAGIVHRDLKPENILLTKDGQVKITDFGIARLETGPRLTEHGGVVGTIDYVSPEYMLKSQVDNRSDIYAIGILAYEMIAGDSPFKGGSVYQTMNLRLKSDPSPPSTKRPECSPALDTIILKAMAREPNDRYQSGTAMAADLLMLQPDDSRASGMFQPIGVMPEPVGMVSGAVSPMPSAQLVATPKVGHEVSTPLVATSRTFERVVISSLYLPLKDISSSLGATVVTSIDALNLNALASPQQEYHMVYDAQHYDGTPRVADDSEQDSAVSPEQSSSGAFSKLATAGISGATLNGLVEELTPSESIWQKNKKVVLGVAFGMIVGVILLVALWAPSLFA